MTNDARFDRPNVWRFDAVRHLGLRGVDMIAGLNTGAGYPDVLEPIVRSVRVSNAPLVDVGAGLGAGTWWVTTRAGLSSAIAVEPEPGVAELAATAFPALRAVAAEARALPLRRRSRRSVILLGVTSLVADLDAVLDEAVDVAGAGGRVAVADLCASSGTTVRPPGSGNVFRPLADLASSVAARGARIEEMWSASAAEDTAWSDVSTRVDDEIARQHGDSPSYRQWHDDRVRLRRLIDDGTLVLGTVTAALD